MAELISLFREGRLDEARTALERRPKVSLTHAEIGLSAELSYLLGTYDSACMTANRILGMTDISPAVKARAASVRASCLYDTAEFGDSLRYSERALEYAVAAQEWSTAAVAVANLVERRSLTTVLDDALPLVPEARRYALRSGDAQARAQVHLVFGRVEGRAGHYDRALRHIEIARLLLRDDPNIWIDAAIDLGEASILSLIGDYCSAIEVVRRGHSKAVGSGWTKGCAVAATNLANFYVFQGDVEKAEEILSQASELLARHPTYSVAVAETRAQAAICRYDFESASAILSESKYQETDSLRWYSLSCRLTEAQTLLAMERWDEALKCATTGLQLAAAAPTHPACAGLKLCQTQARIGLGRPVTGLETEFDTPSPTLDLLVAARQTKAKALVAVGMVSRAQAQHESARRLLVSSGSAPGIARLGSFAAGAMSSSIANSSPTLDSAVTLLDLAGHPQVLGREALAVIEGAECADALALVATGAGSTRIIDQRGWT